MLGGEKMIDWFDFIFHINVRHVITIIGIVSIIIMLTFERKKPEVALSWILVIIFLPITGIVLYVLFGQTISVKLRLRIRRKPKFDAKVNKILYDQLKLLNNEAFELKDTNMEKYVDLIRLNLKQNGSLYSQDNAVKIFTSAYEKYRQLLFDIENAKESINLLYFIIRNDDIGRKIIQALTKKAQDGVIVRLCYDEVGSILTSPRLFKPLIKAGGMVQKFSPSIFFLKLQANFRNHRKIVVIDGKIGYLGGINIGNEYMGLKRIKNWRDTHIRIVGSAVKMLQLRFFLDWLYIFDDEDLDDFDEEKLNLYFPSKIEAKGSTGVQIVSSGPDSFDDEIKNGYMKMINSAKKSILIQTPYFIPDDAFLHSIKIAALSGVDVQVMIPGVPDKRFIYLGTLSYVSDLLNYGVRVFKYDGFLHSKSIVIDDEVSSIGTTNFDVRSFTLNYEVNAFIYDTNIGIRNRKIFEEDLKYCTEITQVDMDKMSKIKKFMCAIVRLFTPLI